MWYTIKSKILKFLSDIRIYPLGIVLYGETGYKIKGNHIRDIIEVLRLGDVLLTRYDHYLGYKLNFMGYYGHAGIYVGNEEIVHMLGGGIQKEDILTFTRKDHILILRHKDSNEADKAVIRALDAFERGVKYDFDFSEFNRTLYCSEAMYEFFDKPKEIKKSMGKWIMPDDLICELFVEVYKAP